MGGTTTLDAAHPDTGMGPATGGWRRFIRHYLEMIVAMLVGMMTLYPLWELAAGRLVTAGWVHRTDVDLTAMAFAMTIPMVGWMLWRGHRGLPVLEMSLAMCAGFWVFFPFLWADALDAMTVMVAGHVAMPVFMLLAMLARRAEYTHPCHAGRAA